MTAEEEAKAKADADKLAAEKRAADALAEAAKSADEASKKERQFWTDAHNGLAAKVKGIEEKIPSASWPITAAIALVLGAFSAIVILLVFVASFARRKG